MSNNILQSKDDAELSPAIAKIREDVEQIISHLQLKNSTAESQFVELGSQLQQLYQESVNLSDAAKAAAQAVSSDNNISGIIQDIAKQILTQFNNVKAINLEVLAQATGASGLLKELAGGIPEFRKIDKQLWILGSNMAIQSSGNVHTQKMFGEYSEELKQFSKSIKGLILDFQNDLKGMSDSLLQVQRSIHSEVQRLDELIAHSKQNISDATAQLETLLSDSIVKIGEVESRSQKMSEGVAHIVTSIQFNDITRQQMEHVREALVETLPTDKPFELYKCMRVQTAQLEHVTQTLADAAQTINASVLEIVECGTEIIEQYNKTHSHSVQRTPFNKIKTALHELDDLLELSASLRKKSTESLKSAAVASGRLSSHLGKIAEITGDLNLQAINALVMSRNIGEGGASLVALSKEVHYLSKESTSIVDGVVQTLRAVGAQTEDLQLLMAREESIDNSKHIKEGFDHIDSIDAAYQDAIFHTRSLGEQLKENTSRVNDSTLFIKKLGDAVSDEVHLLSRAAEELSEHVVHEDSSVIGFDERYTMESERMVQDRVHRELAGHALNDTPVDTAVQTGDDEFGDFELF
ncbi:MAG: hypothetical protein JXX29_22490 [Deltaproteobacteria bacterium]|nr:hypothetical protein [Deltaproteobacteria bacterium]MBN2674466.1 hypothetical protein [Deltaproteobacteria bacterium]